VPLQNRVTPFGDLIDVPERGTWMGNRGGCFHTDARVLSRRRWVSKRWIVCVLDFRGRHRRVMTPGRYTELFFLDEATALAAGHRPCRECRYANHERFKAAWLRGNHALGLSAGASIDEIDAVLHRERVTPEGAKVTFEATFGEVPDGVLIARPADPQTALLVADGRLWRWAPGGYVHAGTLPRATTRVTVLTPRSTVRAIAAGYAPERHRLATERH
jgi:methylphosphotriester-DNA--protein-cysteine methyltransferase